ncbi:MAG: hypothetical protein HY779_00875, partial [Rubrobacteridae bacterium]|nr:hypothetical protein [Rubrobacteridae bacterium]
MQDASRVLRTGAIKLAHCHSIFPKINTHRFKIIAFDWDGTAVENRLVDAKPIAEVLEELMKYGVYVVVITGTNFSNIDRQFSSLINGPHKQNLFICTDRGSQVRGFDQDSKPVMIFDRVASQKENELLTKVAEAVKYDIEENYGPSINIVYDRLNRRKIDLIPEWENPPKSRIDELLLETEKRLRDGGYGEGIKGAFSLAHHYSATFGLTDARITSDVKHVEVGLTDKSDSMKWVIEDLSKRENIPFEDTLVLGDEFGPIAGFEGSDFLTYLQDIQGIEYVSVGKEPNGVPGGVFHIGGGPDCFMEMMIEQVEVNKKLSVTGDKSFLIIENGFEPLREREIESIFTVGNGYLGTRGSLEEQASISESATLVAGVYDRKREGDIEELVVAPNWTIARVFVDGVQLKLEDFNIQEHTRRLDMRKGVLYRKWRHRGDEGRITSVEFERFASLDNPHVMAQRITITPENYTGEIRVETGIEVDQKFDMRPEILEKRTMAGERGVVLTTKTHFTDIEIAQVQISKVAGGIVRHYHKPFINEIGVFEEFSWQACPGQIIELEKFVCIYTSRDSDDPFKSASHQAEMARSKGFEELLISSVEEWERRWKIAEIIIDNDPEAQSWLNFAGYHMMIAGNHRDERVSISARTLTGTIYKGHVFWDTEMFMLPYFIYTHPDTARALLMYRYHTLDGARKEAAQMNLKGALYAWESTTTGEEMTPEFVLTPNGEVILILSGKMEQHINFAVAYGVWHYWTATRDTEFFVNAGAEILIETARFWAGRAEKRKGVYHIFNIEGPDEYHEIVNDSIYTNYTAVWNIKQAFSAIAYLQKNYPEDWERIRAKIGFNDSEFEQWNDVLANMYLDGIDDGNLIEQFDGFFKLKDIDVYEFEPRTAPLDSIIGREQTAASQLVKQADVVLLLYLFEHDFTEQVIRNNFEYYERRTGHGSSLSPSTYGLVAARLGMGAMADKYLKQAGQIDLANNMGNAAGGVHGAALGGLWQQIVMGFIGARVSDEGLYIWPNLPEKWNRVSFSLIWRDSKLRFNIERNVKINVVADGLSEIQLGIYGISQ